MLLIPNKVRNFSFRLNRYFYTYIHASKRGAMLKYSSWLFAFVDVFAVLIILRISLANYFLLLTLSCVFRSSLDENTSFKVEANLYFRGIQNANFKIRSEHVFLRENSY